MAERISEATGERFVPSRALPLGGGCINRSVMLESDNRRFFVKHNLPDRVDMFAAEAEALRAMAATRAVRVPEPICWGAGRDLAFLVLEYLELGSAGERSQATLGRQLAGLHRTAEVRFGWHRDNTIGLTPQPNGWSDDWAHFFRERRLGYQLELAAHGGHRSLAAAGERLLAGVDTLLRDHRPRPSLLHGDLWSGNAGATLAGEPVLFDPAVYFGDREADVAMAELFGGFSGAFYAAYREAWALEPGYEVRRDLYNLYHVLNHVNLFGRAYVAQAERMTMRLLAELR